MKTEYYVESGRIAGGRRSIHRLVFGKIKDARRYYRMIYCGQPIRILEAHDNYPVYVLDSAYWNYL